MSSNSTRSVGGVGNARHSSVARAEPATNQLLGAPLDQLVESVSTDFSRTSAATYGESGSRRYSSLPTSVPPLYRNSRVAGAHEAG